MEDTGKIGKYFNFDSYDGIMFLAIYRNKDIRVGYQYKRNHLPHDPRK